MNAALPTVIYDLIYIFSPPPPLPRTTEPCYVFVIYKSLRDTSTPFLLCIHLIYSLSFQSIFNDFAVPVCLLLLIVVVFYFICLYIVYPV